MYFCVNCGNRIENEKNLCNICGTDMKKIIETKENIDFIAVESNRGDMGKALDEIKKMAKEMITSPITALEKFSVKASNKIAVLIMIIIGIITSLLNIWFFKALLGFVNNIRKNFDDLGLNRNNINSIIPKDDITVLLNRLFQENKIRILAYSISFYIISILIISLILFAVCKYGLKKQVCYGKVMRGFIIASAPYVLFKALAIAASYISLGLSMFFIIMALGSLIIFIYNTLKISLEIEDNKNVVITPIIVSILMLAVMALINYGIKDYISTSSVRQFIAIWTNTIFRTGIYGY
ncbi:YIP1 family protein [Desnuesiella massiliensis]|uniref:YIP1 family protein n=1 Tax=Desnuesiella massiliensis TaxID=1650662 RepID=UPI0006E16986|nr:YIP1 family protein [Desnuesiella massiliensis]